MTEELIWHNDRRKLKELVPTSYNPRRLTEKQHADLTKSLKKFNLAEVPCINTDNRILAGHQRVKVMCELHGLNHEIDVRMPNRELTKEEADEYLIRSNENRGEMDTEKLANYFDTEKLLEWGMSEDFIFGDSGEGTTTDPEDDDVPPADPDNLIVRPGELWALGRHKLFCGDSTNPEDIKSLMGGKKANIVFTDPPYGMLLDTDFTSMKGKGSGKKYKKVIGDNEDFSPKLITTVFENFGYCKEIFLWGADYYPELIPLRS